MREEKARIAALALASNPEKILGPVFARLEFFFGLKSSPESVHSTRPDVDNLTKLVLDACNGIAYVDDGQVCGLVALKFRGGPACTKVTFMTMEEANV